MNPQTIRERRQELIEKLARKYSWTDCNIPKDELNKIYGLNLKLNEFKSGSAEQMCWAMHAAYNPDGFNPRATQAIRNMLNLRKSSDVENRHGILPSPIETACRNLKYDSWYGGGLCAMAYYALDVFSDKVRNRTFTREEFEQQITAKITGADNEAQRRLLTIYFEFKRNGQSFKENGDLRSFPPNSWEMTLKEQEDAKNKEITEAQWNEYKRQHLNPEKPQEPSPTKNNPITQGLGYFKQFLTRPRLRP